MNFEKAIEPWPAATIAKILGCPERIAYSWKSGDKLPREWTQRLILAELRRHDGNASPADTAPRSRKTA